MRRHLDVHHFDQMDLRAGPSMATKSEVQLAGEFFLIAENVPIQKEFKFMREINQGPCSINVLDL